MPNITSKQLLEIFYAEMSEGASFKVTNKDSNPCHFYFEGIEYYAYIKNLSPAHFKNPDVSRAQLTDIDILREIKASNAMFILLGYDSDNEVYATWNPHFSKQRIGTAKSPSFYSRFSLQEEVGKNGEFVLRDLKNGTQVLLFRKEDIGLFLTQIDRFFPDVSDYVAMGSKRRKSANESYRKLVDFDNLKKFAKYLTSLPTYSSEQVGQYVDAIRYLISSSLISKNRKLFLAYDSLTDYSNAVDSFLSLDDVKDMDECNENIYSYAFPVYIEFLIGEYDESIENISIESETDTDMDNDTREENDYETPYIDNDNKLKQIANPQLLDLLRPDLDSQYPSYTAAFATVESFYRDKFSNMTITDWMKLLKNIDWRTVKV